MLKVRFNEQDCKIEAGIDEAGRGCLWGPLIAAAVIWLPEEEWDEECRSISEQIKDSKKLSAKKRGVLRKAIEKFAVDYAVGRVEPEEIDRLGMTAANRLAFERAIGGLSVEADRLLIDGILSLDSVKEQVVQPEADGIYLAVAAASIIAKEVHDEIVNALCVAQPSLTEKYDLTHCKGYGTAKHRAGIKQHGTHPLHRKLFLRKLLGTTLETTQHQEREYKFIYKFIDSTLE